MTIDNTAVTDISGKALRLERKDYNATTNIYTLTLRENLLTNELYMININYTGHLLDDMAGFYRSSYTTANGEKR
jgi:hypothetical protein